MNVPGSRVNRRDLLRLDCAGEAPAQGLGRRNRKPGRMGRVRASVGGAMGSTFEVRLGVTTPGALPLAEQSLDLIDELEQQLRSIAATPRSVG